MHLENVYVKVQYTQQEMSFGGFSLVRPRVSMCPTGDSTSAPACASEGDVQMDPELAAAIAMSIMDNASAHATAPPLPTTTLDPSHSPTGASTPAPACDVQMDPELAAAIAMSIKDNAPEHTTIPQPKPARMTPATPTTAPTASPPSDVAEANKS